MRKTNRIRSESLAEASSPSAGEPGQGEIAAVAHSLWEQAGRPEGHDVEHWLLAEVQIRRQGGLPARGK